MEEQVHAAGAVRHAEKRRRGTCQFANRMAKAALDAYKRTVPASYRETHRQTCVAAVVAHFRESPSARSTEGDSAGSNCNCGEEGTAEGARQKGEPREGRLEVLGLGVGTKFLPDAVLRDEQNGNGYGGRIRDGHAEVLARRAFRRRLAMDVLGQLEGERSGDNVHVQRAGEGGGEEYVPILERAKGNDDAAGSKICFRLKDGVTLHFYASSAPCGNATLKKFTKMEKEKFDDSLGPDEWPEQPHAPIGAHSLRLGQFALLVKKDGSIPRPEPDEDAEPEATPPEETLERAAKRRKPWPCRESDEWCPPSCSIANFHKGTIHSCSDKLCRWNCLGMQGSLLSALLEEPLYPTTLTVGRKFSREICRRAVCCRAEGFGPKGNGSYNDEQRKCRQRYRLSHPVLMETNVYMDEAGTHDMSGMKPIGQDATFESNLCWAWWPGKPLESGYVAECLDGKTGLKINYQCSAEKVREDAESDVSDCSTVALLQLHLEILKHRGAPDQLKWKNDLPRLTLSDVRQLKREVSPEYESAKTELLRHRVFDGWTCRDAG